MISLFTAFWDSLFLENVPTGMETIFGTWSTWFKGIMAFLASAAASVFWTLIGRHVLCWIQWYFCWCLGIIFDWSLAVITPVLRWVPALPTVALGPAVNCWKIVNYWGPLNEVMVLFAVTFFVIWVFRSVRFIKQFIPTASN